MSGEARIVCGNKEAGARVIGGLGRLDGMSMKGMENFEGLGIISGEEELGIVGMEIIRVFFLLLQDSLGSLQI